MSPKRRPRGEGSIYQRADGMWIGMVDLGYTPDGRRKRRTVSSRDRATAIRKFRELRKQVEASGGDMPTATMTVETWMGHWLQDVAGAAVRPRTLEEYRGYVRRYINPILGRRRLDQVQPAHVRALHRHIIDTLELSPTTARQAHAILVKALNDARREGHQTRDIGDLMDPPKKAPGTRRALTVEEAVTLLRHVNDDPFGSRWAAALLLGARQGEVLGLEWDRVDLTAGTVDLAWQLQRLPHIHGCGGKCGRKRAGNCPDRKLAVRRDFEYRHPAGETGGLVLTRPKSRAGQRLVPLMPAMVNILAAHRPDNATGLVWTRADGRPIDPKDDSHAWHDALAGAGVADVPLHSARHSTASLLRRNGVDVATIGLIMGHSSAVSTGAYLHNDLTLPRAAMEGLGRTLALD